MREGGRGAWGGGRVGVRGGRARWGCVGGGQPTSSWAKLQAGRERGAGVVAGARVVCAALTGLLECALARVEQRQPALLICHGRPVALPSVRAEGDRKRRDAVAVRRGVLSDLVAAVLLVAREVLDQHPLDRGRAVHAPLLAAQQRVQHFCEQTRGKLWKLFGGRREAGSKFECVPL